MFINIFIYFLFAVIGYLLWKKSNDREFYWSAVIFAVLTVLSIIKTLSEKFLYLSEEHRLLEGEIYLYIWIAAFILLAWVYAKKIFK